MSRRLLPRNLCLLILTTGFLAAGAASAQDRAVPAALDEALRDVMPLAHTGVLLDRVLPLADIASLDGSDSAPSANRARWRQAYDELRRASIVPPAGPDLAALDASARASVAAGVLPLAWLDRAYDRLRPEALRDGSLRLRAGRVGPAAEGALETSRAVAAAVLAPRSFRGGDLVFSLDRERFLSDDPAPPRAISIDFGDGRGPRPVALGERVAVHYDRTGTYALEARVTRADGSLALARFTHEVAALAAPLPDDTLHITATIPYQGSYGTGDAYVALAPGHTSLVNPVVVIEGFDLDNSMNWDELYALLDQQNLIETLRADGFDAVVLNFTDATEPIQKNAFVVAELVQQVQAAIAPSASLALVGASMGGLCSRYALAYMESHAMPHRVRTWLSFDGPQAGADIPLGLQYWIRFFSAQSADAAAFLATLNRPAARQMLLYHFTDPATATASPDPMRTALVSELASLGDYPALTRRVAVANGSGTGLDQGFAPRDQLIRYEYSSFLVSLTGNVWALPNQVSGTVFQGSQRIVISTTSQTVTVNNALPWDGAPGGSRASMAELDATSPPYGDIVALHPSHCFIPTVSSLALSTADPFFNVSTAPDVYALTPFDAVFHPDANEEHVSLTAASAAWIRNELETGVLDAPAPPALNTLRLTASPNPFRSVARIGFTLPRGGHADLRIHGVDGREVKRLYSGAMTEGAHTLAWDGRDARGVPAAPGLYFVRCVSGDTVRTQRLVKLR